MNKKIYDSFYGTVSCVRNMGSNNGCGTKDTPYISLTHGVCVAHGVISILQGESFKKKEDSISQPLI